MGPSKRLGVLALALLASACSTRNQEQGHGVGVDPKDCVACHLADFQRVTRPQHAGQLPTTCSDCHTVGGWVPATTGPHPETSFPIQSGPHQGIACADCHDRARGAFTGGVNATCTGCHQHVQSTVDGQHQGVSGYAFDASKQNFCLTCHSNGLASLLHPEDRFPIAAGAHKGIPCSDCHDGSRGGSAGGQNANCTGCHSGTHAQTLADSQHPSVDGYSFNQTDARFCLTCHPAGSAEGMVHPETVFPIRTGAHTSILCASCHDATRGAKTGGQNTNCIGCHTGDHAQSVADPQHRGVADYGFKPSDPRFCVTCHPNGSAQGLVHPEARFPIQSGAHGQMACNDCHDPTRGANAGGQNVTCTGCHTGKHSQSIVDPLHAGVTDYAWSAANPKFCLGCHPSGTASGAAHPESLFPIQAGAHSGIACNDCHDQTRGSNAGGRNTSCTGCHAGKHTQTVTNPQHAGVDGYAWSASDPRFCASCHPRGSAAGMMHPETKFPIASGSHAALKCADCHDPALGVNAAGKNVNCTGCHSGTHAQTVTNPQHAGVNGYAWSASDPKFCLSCHPTGSASGLVHPEAKFPITTGAHAALACNDCHDPARGANTGGQNTSCIGCHSGQHAQSVVDPRHTGVSGYSFDSTKPHFCLTCHADGKAAAHPEAKFPIASGAHAMPCNDCHVPSLGPYSGGQNTSCTGCHTGRHAQSVVDSQHRGVSRYSFDPTNPHFCLSCHPNGRGG